MMWKKEFQRIKRNIPGDGLRSNLDTVKSIYGDDDDGIDLCSCNPGPRDSCCCTDIECLNVATQTECSLGKCNEKCGNQRMQKLQYAKLEVFKAGGKGWGLRLEQNVPNDHFLIEYLGEIIDSEKLGTRMEESGRGNSMLYLMELAPGLYLDGRRKGSIARFINHSCEPNCRLENWRAGGRMRCAVFSIQAISAGTEITFDYQWTHHLGRQPTRCLCRSELCREYIEMECSGDDFFSENEESDSFDSSRTQVPEKILSNAPQKNREYGFQATIDAFSLEKDICALPFEWNPVPRNTSSVNNLRKLPLKFWGIAFATRASPPITTRRHKKTRNEAIVHVPEFKPNFKANSKPKFQAELKPKLMASTEVSSNSRVVTSPNLLRRGLRCMPSIQLQNNPLSGSKSVKQNESTSTSSKQAVAQVNPEKSSRNPQVEEHLSISVTSASTFKLVKCPGTQLQSNLYNQKLSKISKVLDSNLNVLPPYTKAKQKILADKAHPQNSRSDSFPNLNISRNKELIQILSEKLPPKNQEFAKISCRPLNVAENRCLDVIKNRNTSIGSPCLKMKSLKEILAEQSKSADSIVEKPKKVSKSDFAREKKLKIPEENIISNTANALMELCPLEGVEKYSKESAGISSKIFSECIPEKEKIPKITLIKNRHKSNLDQQVYIQSKRQRRDEDSSDFPFLKLPSYSNKAHCLSTPKKKNKFLSKKACTSNFHCNTYTVKDCLNAACSANSTSNLNNNYDVYQKGMGKYKDIPEDKSTSLYGENYDSTPFQNINMAGCDMGRSNPNHSELKFIAYCNMPDAPPSTQLGGMHVQYPYTAYPHYPNIPYPPDVNIQLHDQSRQYPYAPNLSSVHEIRHNEGLRVQPMHPQCPYKNEIPNLQHNWQKMDPLMFIAPGNMNSNISLNMNVNVMFNPAQCNLHTKTADDSHECMWVRNNDAFELLKDGHMKLNFIQAKSHCTIIITEETIDGLTKLKLIGNSTQVDFARKLIAAVRNVDADVHDIEPVREEHPILDGRGRRRWCVGWNWNTFIPKELECLSNAEAVGPRTSPKEAMLRTIQIAKTISEHCLLPPELKVHASILIMRYETVHALRGTKKFNSMSSVRSDWLNSKLRDSDLLGLVCVLLAFKVLKVRCNIMLECNVEKIVEVAYGISCSNQSDLGLSIDARDLWKSNIAKSEHQVLHALHFDLDFEDPFSLISMERRNNVELRSLMVESVEVASDVWLKYNTEVIVWALELLIGAEQKDQTNMTVQMIQDDNDSKECAKQLLDDLFEPEGMDYPERSPLISSDGRPRAYDASLTRIALNVDHLEMIEDNNLNTGSLTRLNFKQSVVLEQILQTAGLRFDSDDQNVKPICNQGLKNCAKSQKKKFSQVSMLVYELSAPKNTENFKCDKKKKVEYKKINATELFVIQKIHSHSKSLSGCRNVLVPIDFVSGPNFNEIFVISASNLKICLFDVLHIYRNSSDSLIPPIVLEHFVRGLLQGLAAIHSADFILCTIQPECIYVTNRGDIQYGGFHNIRLAETSSEHSKKNHPRHNIQEYISSSQLQLLAPELIANSNLCSAASDLWGVGSLISYLSFGMPLFNAETSENLLKMIFECCGLPNSDNVSYAKYAIELLQKNNKKASACYFPSKLPERIATERKNAMKKHNISIDIRLEKLLCTLLNIDSTNRISANEILRLNAYPRDLTNKYADFVSNAFHRWKHTSDSKIFADENSAVNDLKHRKILVENEETSTEFESLSKRELELVNKNFELVMRSELELNCGRNEYDSLNVEKDDVYRKVAEQKGIDRTSQTCNFLARPVRKQNCNLPVTMGSTSQNCNLHVTMSATSQNRNSPELINLGSLNCELSVIMDTRCQNCKCSISNRNTDCELKNDSFYGTELNKKMSSSVTSQICDSDMEIDMIGGFEINTIQSKREDFVCNVSVVRHISNDLAERPENTKAELNEICQNCYLNCVSAKSNAANVGTKNCKTILPNRSNYNYGSVTDKSSCSTPEAKYIKNIDETFQEKEINKFQLTNQNCELWSHSFSTSTKKSY